MSPDEARRMIEDAESGETRVSYTRKRSRRGLLVLLLIAAAVVSGAAGGVLHDRAQNSPDVEAVLEHLWRATQAPPAGSDEPS